MTPAMVRADRCPDCGSELITFSAISYQVDCLGCGWTGEEHELVTAQDIADEMGDAEYHRRVDEAVA